MDELSQLKELNKTLIKELYAVKKNMSGLRYDIFKKIERGDHKQDNYLDDLERDYRIEYRNLDEQEAVLIALLDKQT